jgi:hypothetical protein
MPYRSMLSGFYLLLFLSVIQTTVYSRFLFEIPGLRRYTVILNERDPDMAIV